MELHSSLASLHYTYPSHSPTTSYDPSIPFTMYSKGDKRCKRKEVTAPAEGNVKKRVVEQSSGTGGSSTENTLLSALHKEITGVPSTKVQAVKQSTVLSCSSNLLPQLLGVWDLKFIRSSAGAGTWQSGVTRP
ncbi:hypothetical protein GUJ93_ZPchr0006g44944 [Zizania palustris]|uniref:Uncharacterized protein n=1 Tax=Zizania palustris TaxID=103762 RepID=A0A8J5W315_ZIZPA|nr:hypothetical protein GUJ93_ZPchr0006g44944 [Zizania palustris]